MLIITIYQAPITDDADSYVMEDLEHARGIFDVHDRIYDPFVAFARLRPDVNIVVETEGRSTEKASRIVTHSGTTHGPSTRGDTRAVFVGDEARKIILNWGER